MKKITCIGYHATGSGVVDDLLREFDNVDQGKYGAEIRVLHDVDGVSDLEYHLVVDPHRFGSSLALLRFRAYAESQDRMIRKIMGNEWMKIVNRYVTSLMLFQFEGYHSTEVPFFSSQRRLYIRFRYLCDAVMRRILPSKYCRPRWYNYHPSYKTSYSKLTEDEFLQKTKTFVEDICRTVNKQNKEYVVVDQFVATHNPGRTMRYVDDLKVIVVDKDPRDLYIQECVRGGRVLPKDPQLFCKHYRMMRRLVTPDDPAKVLRVHVEDFMYHYDEAVKQVMDFLGIDMSHHVCPKKYFNPAVSIRNTKNWESHPGYADEVKVIEQSLPDMLYQFPEDDTKSRLMAEIDTKSAEKAFDKIR